MLLKHYFLIGFVDFLCINSVILQNSSKVAPTSKEASMSKVVPFYGISLVFMEIKFRQRWQPMLYNQ